MKRENGRGRLRDPRRPLPPNRRAGEGFAALPAQASEDSYEARLDADEAVRRARLGILRGDWLPGLDLL